jgi:hypothetical protein
LQKNGIKNLHPVTVFQNLNTLLIDAIHHMSITYLSFMFIEDIIGENKFRKADLMTAQGITIPARTCVPVRLGTASEQRFTLMAAEIKSVTTVDNPDYPALFSQPGLVVPNYEGDFTILL